MLTNRLIKSFPNTWLFSPSAYGKPDGYSLETCRCLVFLDDVSFPSVVILKILFLIIMPTKPFNNYFNCCCKSSLLFVLFEFYLCSFIVFRIKFSRQIYILNNVTDTCCRTSWPGESKVGVEKYPAVDGKIFIFIVISLSLSIHTHTHINLRTHTRSHHQIWVVFKSRKNKRGDV